MSLHPYLNRSKVTAISIGILRDKAKNSAIQGQDKGKINLRQVNETVFFIHISTMPGNIKNKKIWLKIPKVKA